ncbi:MAG: zinc transporter ZupT [Synergistaceae bacterium]|nr:zinc transporter ZupT [Synergistota bacterium]NLM72134.1 zinc transporter ZupT [Synergistaceae bacterium]
MENGNVLFALSLTLLAGLSTGIGSALAFFTKRTNTRFLAFSLGLSAGVMIYVSMVEIFFKAQTALQSALGETEGAWATATSFFAGIIAVMLIDKFVPSEENPHEPHRVEEIRGRAGELGRERSLLRMGLMTAIAIAIHNFPEGIATFMAGLQDPHLGVPIAFAIAIHNIPEGIAVSVPIYYATGSRRKAFCYSFLSGVAEPLGALLAWLVLMPFLTDALFGVVFAAVAGIMVFISVDQLLPAARKYGEHHISIYGLVLGMMIMAVSLLLFL